jgi:hypothetical protein
MLIRLTLIILGAYILGAAMAMSCSPPAVSTQLDEQFRELAELEAELSKTRIQIAEMRAELLRREAHVRMMSDRIAHARTMLARLEARPMKDDPRLWAAIRKAVEVKLLPASCVQDDYLQNIEKIRQVLAAADEATVSPSEPTPNAAWRCNVCGRPLDVSEPLRPRHVDGPQNHEAELSGEDCGILAGGSKPG